MKIFLDCKDCFTCDIARIAMRRELPLVSSGPFTDGVIDEASHGLFRKALWQIDVGDITGRQFLEWEICSGLQSPYDTCCGTVTNKNGNVLGTYRYMYLPKKNSEKILVIELSSYSRY